LLLFFPFAFSSTCTTELCNIRDNFALYNKINANVFGISTDSHFALKKFREDQKLNFDLLSDYNKDISRAYDSLYENWGYHYKGVTKRSAFVIDKEGVLKHMETVENAGELPNFAAFNKVLETLK
jgi:peroxiredoxin